jgi:uncharacterized protein
LYIQTGYGAEGFLTDAMASRIIDQIITPAFRREAYFQGLDEGTSVIMQLGSGEYENTGLEKDASGSGLEALFILMLIILVVIVLANIFNRGDDWDDWDDDGGYHRRGKYDYDQYGRPKSRRSRSGGWIFIPGGGGWSGGGGGWSGGGGGGFGGFGGGGFGGGGAGGSW